MSDQAPNPQPDATPRDSKGWDGKLRLERPRQTNGEAHEDTSPPDSEAEADEGAEDENEEENGNATKSFETVERQGQEIEPDEGACPPSFAS